MSLIINKSIVPRVAVEKTIRRGIELWSLANDNKPAPKEVVEKITRMVVAHAHIMNAQGGIKGNEARSTPGLH